MPTISDLTGKVAIVTGAAAGVGQATALALANACASVALVDRHPANETYERITEMGASALIIEQDLAASEQCAQVIEKTLATFGRIDSLCNVAGVFLPRHTQAMTLTEWQTTLAVNLTAPFLLIQAALEQLIQHQGAVVNVTSCAAHMGQPYVAAYSASKAGLSHMTKSLAMEYMHQGVRFNVVAPGGMATALAAGLRDLENPDPSLLGRVTPLRGLVSVEDLGDMVAFLASDAAQGYQGAIINLDNGITVG